MRILTHNTLRCNAKDVVHGYPLRLHVISMEVRETPLNEDFIRHILLTLNWPAVLIAADAVGLQGLPLELVPDLASDGSFLQAVHRLLLDVHILEGTMACPESGRTFLIKDGVPNMMLPESDV